MYRFQLIGALDELKKRMRVEVEQRPHLKENEKAFGLALVKHSRAIVPWKNISRNPREIPHIAEEIVTEYAREGGNANAVRLAREKLAVEISRRIAS